MATNPIASAPTAKAPSAKAPKASAPAESARRPVMSEGEPVPAVGIDLVLCVHAGAEAHACAHGCECDPAAALVIDAQPGHKIEAAFHARIALEQAFVLAQVVDQGEAFGGIGAHIEAHRWPLPIDLPGFARFADQPARAIAQPHHEGAGAFIAFDI